MTEGEQAPGGDQARRCAELVETWVGHGLRMAMIAPGSRSTPLALALVEHPGVAVEVFVDERSAAFAALGWSLSGPDPAAVLCTSGTAATHFHAAVVEAHQSGVPLLVLTADRPPELQGIGAPQTIDQANLYGAAVRAFIQLDGHDDDWTEPAVTAWRTAVGANDARPGPVQINVALRDPLSTFAPVTHTRSRVPVVARDNGNPAPSVLVGGSRGVILAGAGVDDPSAVGALAERRGWPVLADPRSGCRALPGAVCASDAIVRAIGDRLRLEVVVQLGAPPASKVVGQWIAASAAEVIAVSPAGLVSDPYLAGARQVHSSVAAFCAGIDGGPVDPEWLAKWLDAEALAQNEIERSLSATLTEIAVARRLSRLPAGEALVVSSSMPVRDLEWFGAPGQGPTVFSNRGANGIDGVVATAIGVAARGVPTTVLIGDVALLHDSSSLAMLARRDLDLAIVVVDNDGGGIFSFLPQATEVEQSRFELLFGTPHGTDLEALAKAHDIAASTVTTPAELDQVLAAGGVRLAVIPSERAANVEHHRRLNAAIEAALN